MQSVHTPQSTDFHVAGVNPGFELANQELNIAASQDQESAPAVMAYHDEMMLVSWAESSRAGRTVTFVLPEEGGEHPFKQFATKNGKIAGQRFAVVMVLIGDDEKPVETEVKPEPAVEVVVEAAPAEEVEVVEEKPTPEKPFGKSASILHKRGWFYENRVLRAVGSIKDFTQWISTQPCCVCGAHGPSIAVMQPGVYGGLPVCEAHQDINAPSLASKQGALVKEWISQALGSLMGVESLGYVNPSDLALWAWSVGIAETLPKEYLESTKTKK